MISWKRLLPQEIYMGSTWEHQRNTQIIFLKKVILKKYCQQEKGFSHRSLTKYIKNFFSLKRFAKHKP